MKKSLVLLCVIMVSLVAHAKVEHLLPVPKDLELKGGKPFALGRNVCIQDPTGSGLLREVFADNGCGESLSGTPVVVTIVREIKGAYDYDLPGYENEAYCIDVASDRIEITAVTPVGVIRAAQTLAQLAEGWDGSSAIECVRIMDYPSFKLRGYMHDVGRSYISVDELMRQMKLLARFKVNTFHWHMTENQAWRFEVKRYPQLTSDTAMTRFPGLYYTQEECRQVAALAKELGMVVIPEIDMPGHSEAFVRAMGCGMQTPHGKQVLNDVLGEVAEVFADAPYIHIGADEQAITDSTFLREMTGRVHELGKRVVCWNPIHGVDIGAESGFDMTQMWSTAGKLVKGVPNIDCRYNYTNHFDVFADLVGIYRSSIYYSDKGSPEIAGTISAPWNDRKTPCEDDIMKQNNFYANVIASASRGWRGGGEQYIEEGGTSIPVSGDGYAEFADWERRFLFHKAHSLKGTLIPYVRQTNVRWLVTDAFPNGGDAEAIFPPEDSIADNYIYDGRSYGVHEAVGAAVYLRHTWGSIIPGFYGKDAELDRTAYAYTYVYAPEAMQAGAIVEFQNYGRSEKDLAPENGMWDWKGSRVWLNGEELLPPVWSNAGVPIDNEVELGNENFTARPPVPVHLDKGWNKVLMKLPYVSTAGKVRLNKWMFTFVLTDKDGLNALDGVIYSPYKKLEAGIDGADVETGL